MNLIYKKIEEINQKSVDEIYEIIKVSGQDMFEKQGLTHWKKPYPKEFIIKNILEREVYIVVDNVTNQAINTFQIELKDNDFIGQKIAEIHKFATHPAYSGKGIGKKSLNFIEKWCKEKLVDAIRLTVYNKSMTAVEFYIKNGFKIIEESKTTNYNILIMEKRIKDYQN